MKYSTLAAVDNEFGIKARLTSRLEKIDKHAATFKEHDGHLVNEHRRWIKDRIARLDNNSLIRTMPTNELEKRFGDTRTHMERLFGEYVQYGRKRSKDWLDNVINKKLEGYADASKRFRVNRIIFEVEQEARVAYSRGEYLIFNTLTVSDQYYDEVFYSEKSQLWNNYLKWWSRNTTRHRYIAVVERGGETNRLHIHVLHVFANVKTIRWLQDPNFGRNIPDRREAYYLKNVWKGGYSTPIIVRFSDYDAYGKLGHRWPVEYEKETKQWKMMECRPPVALARYMGKYVTKTYGKEKHRWRTRKSRGFGSQTVRLAMRLLSTTALRYLVTNPVMINQREQKTIHIPEVKVEVEATRELCRRIRKKTRITVFFRDVQRQKSLAKRLEDMILMRQDRNPQKHGNIGMKKSINMAISEEIREVMWNIEQVLDLNGLDTIRGSPKERV